MKIKEVLVKIGLTISSIAAAVFYVLFQQKKQENLKQQLEAVKEEKDQIQKVQDRYVEGMKKNEELKNKARTASSDNDRDAASMQLLQNAARK